MKMRLIKPLFLCLLLGGLTFSVLLTNLGIDIVSPELLRYMLIATLPLALLLVIVIARYASGNLSKDFTLALCGSFLIWVPLESITYLLLSWSAQGKDLFTFNSLGFLLLMLTIWSVLIALPVLPLALTARGIVGRKHR